MKILLQALFFLLFVSAASFAQRKPMVTDRPDQTDSPVTIPIGYVQIESGLLYSNQKFENLNPSVEIFDISFLGTLVRYGITENIELRFGGEYLFQSTKINDVVSEKKGLSALVAGAKLQLISSEKSFLDAALICDIALPFGSSDFKPEKLEPKAALSVSHPLVGPLKIGYNFGTQYRSNISKYENFYSVSLGWEVSDIYGVFLENYGKFMKSATPAFFLDAGVTYLHSFNIQVDLYFGKEITPSTNAWFIGAGFAIRLPD
jgi:hypothetical protein